MNLFSTLAKILPPPSYITMPGVGVDISDTSLKYVSFMPSLRPGDSRILDQWGDIDIPNGILERGRIIDPKLLVGVLKELKDKTGAEFIRVSLPEERAYIFETEIKRDVPAKEVRSLLEFRLEENVPIPARDAIFDYEILGGNENNRTVRVVVAAYQKDTILKYYDVCKEAKLTPLSFEVEAQAMARSVVSPDCSQTIMLVDFGKARTGIGIVNSGSLLYTSTIDIGGGQLSQVMRKVLGDVSESELTEIKNNNGLIRKIGDTEMHDSLISTISVIKDEIASRMQYWHQKDDNQKNRQIKKIVICGGSVNLKGLPEYFTESLNIPCIRGNVWENAFQTEIHVPPIEKRYSYGFATAIGLAIKNIV